MFETAPCSCRLTPRCADCHGTGRALTARGQAAECLFQYATTVEAQDVRPGDRLRIGQPVVVETVASADDRVLIQWENGERLFPASKRIQLDLDPVEVAGLLRAALAFQNRLPSTYGRIHRPDQHRVARNALQQRVLL